MLPGKNLFAEWVPLKPPKKICERDCADAIFRNWAKAILLTTSFLKRSLINLSRIFLQWPQECTQWYATRRTQSPRVPAAPLTPLHIFRTTEHGHFVLHTLHGQMLDPFGVAFGQYIAVAERISTFSVVCAVTFFEQPQIKV